MRRPEKGLGCIPPMEAHEITLEDIEPVENQSIHRLITGLITLLPFVGLGVAIWQTWESALGWSDVIVFVIVYLCTGLGVTVGFHRMLTHRSFNTSPFLPGFFAALGSA